jgi:hypothetical protein
MGHVTRCDRKRPRVAAWQKLPTVVVDAAAATADAIKQQNIPARERAA